MTCSRCGKGLIGQDAKSGRFSYYVCGSILRKGAGACDTPYLPKDRFEELVLQVFKTRILAEDNLRSLVALVAEEMDRAGPAWRQHLDSIVAELADIGQRLTNLYDALETRKLSLDDLVPRIQSLR